MVCNQQSRRIPFTGCVSSWHPTVVRSWSLGISPIVTSGLVMQLLAGSRIIEVDYNVRKIGLFSQGLRSYLGF
jgi:hypothetical protein